MDQDEEEQQLRHYPRQWQSVCRCAHGNGGLHTPLRRIPSLCSPGQGANLSPRRAGCSIRTSGQAFGEARGSLRTHREFVAPTTPRIVRKGATERVRGMGRPSQRRINFGQNPEDVYMTSTIAAPIGAIIAIFWRTVTPGDFFNIERSPETGPKGGGGQRYIDIPLGRGVSLQDFGSFLGRPLSYNDQTWPTVEIQAHTVSSPVIAAPLTLTSRQINRRYRIAQQTDRHREDNAILHGPRIGDSLGLPMTYPIPEILECQTSHSLRSTLLVQILTSTMLAT